MCVSHSLLELFFASALWWCLQKSTFHQPRSQSQQSFLLISLGSELEQTIQWMYLYVHQRKCAWFTCMYNDTNSRPYNIIHLYIILYAVYLYLTLKPMCGHQHLLHCGYTHPTVFGSNLRSYLQNGKRPRSTLWSQRIPFSICSQPCIHAMQYCIDYTMWHLLSCTSNFHSPYCHLFNDFVNDGTDLQVP